MTIILRTCGQRIKCALNFYNGIDTIELGIHVKAIGKE